MKKSLKFIILLLVVFIIYMVVIVGYNNYLKSKNKTSEIVKIEGYEYGVSKDDTKYYRGLFNQLVVELKEDKINDENYAKLVSEMFVTDFYSLNDKRSKNDVGGVSFVYEGARSNFILEASDTIYKYVEQNLYNDREQNLPEVKEVEITNVENVSYKYGTSTDDKAYAITLSIDYVTDLGYPTKVKVILVHEKKEASVPIKKKEYQFSWWPFNYKEEEQKYETKTITKLAIVSLKNA